MIILNSTEDEGVFYVETKNLDGETNLKLKHVAKELVPVFANEAAFSDQRGVINIQKPNNQIYKFDGNFDLSSTQSSPKSKQKDEKDASLVSDLN